MTRGELTVARMEEAEPDLVIVRAIFPQIPRFGENKTTPQNTFNFSLHSCITFATVDYDFLFYWRYQTSFSLKLYLS